MTTPGSVTRTNDAAGDSFLTFQDGSGRHAQGVVPIDENGAQAGVSSNPLRTSGPVPGSRFVTAGAAARGEQLGGAGVLREINVLSISAASMYLQLFDLAAPPAAGAVPVFRGLVPAGSQFIYSFSGGYAFANGIYAALSTDPAVYADPGADEGFFYAEME